MCLLGRTEREPIRPTRRTGCSVPMTVDFDGSRDLERFCVLRSKTGQGRCAGQFLEAIRS